MKSFYFCVCCIFVSLTIIYAQEPEKTGCLEKEKALTLLETAENLLAKARDTLPACNGDVNSTNQSECGKKKPLAYIEVSKKLISDVRKNFPQCPKPVIEDEKPKDCSEILASGHNDRKIYTIWPREPFTTRKPLQVYCDMETDKGGWTVIQRRGKYSYQQDFHRDWETYKNGFGNLTEEFWLGNENIRVLCHEGCEIRFDLQDESGNKGFAQYQSFNLSGTNYRIGISGYAGNAGDSMQHGNNWDFSTKDKGNTPKVNIHKGGWWYGDSGYFCNLNGIYQPGKSNDWTVGWYGFRQTANLARVEMKVRPK